MGGWPMPVGMPGPPGPPMRAPGTPGPPPGGCATANVAAARNPIVKNPICRVISTSRLYEADGTRQPVLADEHVGKDRLGRPRRRALDRREAERHERAARHLEPHEL